MNSLVSECNEFLKECGFSYAICGGYAIELFLKKSLRTHGDIDITVFEEDRAAVTEYIINKGWNVYEHGFKWIDNKKTDSYLRQIMSSDDERLSSLNSLWALKPGCSFFNLDPRHGEENVFKYEITNTVQLNPDYIGIEVNRRRDGSFVLDPFSSQGKDITRELEKAILFTDEGIPYLAPEVILFIISYPAYLKSDYHKVKNRVDFDSAAPLLPKESKEWLINALETAYPDGLERIGQLKNMNG